MQYHYATSRRLGRTYKKDPVREVHGLASCLFRVVTLELTTYLAISDREGLARSTQGTELHFLSLNERGSRGMLKNIASADSSLTRLEESRTCYIFVDHSERSTEGAGRTKCEVPARFRSACKRPLFLTARSIINKIHQKNRHATKTTHSLLFSWNVQRRRRAKLCDRRPSRAKSLLLLHETNITTIINAFAA